MTTGSGDRQAEIKARCAGWPKPGRNAGDASYSASKDTPETIAFVRTYKRVGQKKKCWK